MNDLKQAEGENNSKSGNITKWFSASVNCHANVKKCSHIHP